MIIKVRIEIDRFVIILRLLFNTKFKKNDYISMKITNEPANNVKRQHYMNNNNLLIQNDIFMSFYKFQVFE